MHGHYVHIEVCKEQSATDIWVSVIINMMLFETVIALRNYVKNKSILSPKQNFMNCYICSLSNVI